MGYPIQTAAQLATHLRALRNARHLTQAQLGKLMGLPQSRIAKIERDPTLVSMRQVLQLLNALGVQVILQAAGNSKPRVTRSTADW
jgi:transcriptional regulator with XRE-family HTH domain